MDNQNSNNMNGSGQDMGGGLSPLQPLQPLQPTPVSTPVNKGFSFDVPKPVVGEDVIAAARVEMPTPTPNAVSSSTLSSFSDFKPVNNFSTANTQSSQAQLSSGVMSTSRSSKKTIIGIIVVIILVLLIGGGVYAFMNKFKPGGNIFSLFGMTKVAPAGVLNQDLIPQEQTTPVESQLQPDQTIIDQYTTPSPTLDTAPVTPVQEVVPELPPQKAPGKFPKSGIGPEKGPL